MHLTQYATPAFALVVLLLVVLFNDTEVAQENDGIELERSKPQQSNDHRYDHLLVRPGDRPYINVDYCGECSPVVVEKYKLVFFTIPKAGSTSWRYALRRMMGYDDWRKQGRQGLMPHNKKANGLKLLNGYSLDAANEIMTSPEWTRAIFVRDPKARLLSAYLDRVSPNIPNNPNAVGNVLRRCCEYLSEEPSQQECWSKARTFEDFVHYLLPRCMNDHWRPQHLQMPERYWKHIDFIGHLENAEEDARILMQRIGAWEEHGSNGWGEYQNETMFMKNPVPVHSTGAADRMRQYYTPEVERLVEKIYEDDYNDPLLNFTLEKLYP